MPPSSTSAPDAMQRHGTQDDSKLISTVTIGKLRELKLLLRGGDLDFDHSSLQMLVASH
jgi:hypothetical protein